MSSNRPLKACYNCMRRRIVCDLTTPKCKKCEKKGLDCPGYGIRYRFADLKSVPPAELGPVQASSVAVPPPQRSKRGGRNLKWMNGLSRRKRSAKTSTTESSKNDEKLGKPSSCKGSGIRSSWSQQDTDSDLNSTLQQPTNIPETPEFLPRGDDFVSVQVLPCSHGSSNQTCSLCFEDGISAPDSRTVAESCSSLEDKSALATSRVRCHIGSYERNSKAMLLNLPPLLSKTNPRTRLLFDHFSTHVCPVMLLYDDESNGYRYQILPLALSDPIVERAVCVAAAFHWSRRWPELRLPAESGQAAIITKMTEKSLDLSDTTWATIILLIMTDLITGHEHILTLYNMLVAFLNARGQAMGMGAVPRETSLGKFLYEQSRLISFFACPVLGKSEAIEDFTHTLRDPLVCLERLAPLQTKALELIVTSKESQESPIAFLDMRTKLYFDIIREASEIYIIRAKHAAMDHTDKPHAAFTAVQCMQVDETIRRQLAHVRFLFEQVDPSAPGSHSIVWPAFVAAAESCTNDDRMYFSSVLQQIWDSTGYSNVLKGLEALPGIWKSQDRGKNWTSMLINLKTLIM